MTITQELKDLVTHWVETGEWEALHDALLEYGWEGMAWHISPMDSSCGGEGERPICLVTRAIVDDREPTFIVEGICLRWKHETTPQSLAES